MKLTKKEKAKIIDSLNGFSLLFGVYILFKTKSFVYAGIAIFLPILVIQIVRVGLIWNKNKLLKRSGIKEIDQMDGFLFEEYLALLFEKQGYKSKVTKARGDFGADLTLSKDGIKTVVQAKRYSKNVGIKAIQEIVSAVTYYKATNALVVTNSYFTRPAIKLALANGVELIDRDKLIKLILSVNPEDQPVKLKIKIETNEEEVGQEPECPNCKIEMVVRNSRNGKRFYGCSNFPSCRQTLSM